MRAILPPDIYQSEVGKYPFLQDVDKVPSYKKEGATKSGSIVSIDENEIYKTIQSRKAVALKRGLNITTPNFWDIVFDTIDACLNNPISKGYFIEGLEIWIEAKKSILNNTMPSIKGAEGVLWSEFLGEDYLTSLHPNEEDKKIIFKTNQNGICLSMEEIWELRNYSKNNVGLEMIFMIYLEYQQKRYNSGLY